MTALTALAVAGETRLVPLMTCETVETETPASRATSVIVDTSPPRGSPLSRLAQRAAFFDGEASRSKRLRNRFDRYGCPQRRRAGHHGAGSQKRPESTVNRQAGRDEDHLYSFHLGEIYASSGIRRRTENEMVHEIDWALFEFQEHRLPITNHIKNGSRHCSQKEGRYPLAVAPSTELPNLNVHCMARTSGLQSGRILPGMVIVKIYGRQTPSSSFQVAGKLGVPGDSGAWVVDNEKGRACGHVLAWSSKKRVAYICPMDVLVKDIGETIGAKSISLPGGSEIYTSNSTSMTSDENVMKRARDEISTSHLDRIVSKADPSDVSDELATLLAELNLPPTPTQIDGLDPASLGSTSSGSLAHQGKKKEEVRIRLVPRDENQLGRSRQDISDALGFGVKATGMQGWRSKDSFAKSGKESGGEEGVVAS